MVEMTLSKPLVPKRPPEELAKRSVNSWLNCSAFTSHLDIELQDWVDSMFVCTFSFKFKIYKILLGPQYLIYKVFDKWFYDLIHKLNGFFSALNCMCSGYMCSVHSLSVCQSTFHRGHCFLREQMEPKR